MDPQQPTNRPLDVAMLAALAACLGWFWTARVMTPTTNYLIPSWDLFLYFEPMYDYVGRAIRAARVPLWNPHQGCGEPLLGVLQGGVLYPARLLLLFLDTPRAMAWSAVGHIGLALFGMFLYARGLGTSRSGAAVAALAFAFGVIASMLHQPATFLEPGPWLPLAAFAIHRVSATGRWRWVALTSLSIAAPILAGGYQIAVYSAYGVAATCLGLWLDPTTRRTALTLRSLGLVSTCAVLAVLLSAAQWAPTLAWAPETLRPAAALALERIDPFQAPPLLVLQSLLGRHDLLEGVFLPVPIAVLAVIGMVRTPRMLAPLVVLTIVSLGLSLGSAAPWFRLYYLLPGFAIFRAPARLHYLVVFGAAVSAGGGVDVLRRHAARRPRFADVTVAGIVAVAMLVYAVFPAVKNRASATPELDRYDVAAAGATAAIGFLSPPLVGPVALAASAAAVWRTRTNGAVLPYSPGAPTVARHTATYQALAKRSELWRTIGAASGRDWLMPAFAAKNAMRHGFETVDDYEPLAQARLVHYLAAMVYGAAGREHEMRMLSNVIVEQPFARPRLLDLASVRYLVAPDVPRNPVLDALPAYRAVEGLVEPMDRGQIKIFENPGALPRAYLVPAIRPAGSDDEALELIAAPMFDPRREVVAVDAPRLAVTPSVGDVNDTATIVSYAPEHVTIATTANGKRALVLTDAFAPGWTVTVDGRDAPIWRANYLFRGVALLPGSHEVTFTYAAPGYRAGLFAVLVAMLVLVGVPAMPLLLGRSRSGCSGMHSSDTTPPT